MQLTSTGKWLLEQVLAKDIDEQDQGLCAIADVLQFYDPDYDSGDLEQDDPESECIAIGLGLLQ